MSDSPLVLSEVRNQIGHITLNRPSAYNATNLAMVRLILAQLQAWQQDAQVRAVVLRAAGDKAFCAGGDIRELYDNQLAGSSLTMEFFRQEYALDQLIHDYPKPLLALGEGLVLGGGMGLFQGAALRVITQHARLGMPETGIGYFPDVGGSYFLSRLAGETGTLLGVSGNMVNAADAMDCGLADYLIDADSVPALDQALDALDWQQPALDSLQQLLESLAMPVLDNGVLAAVQPAIDRHFAHDSVEQIMASLDAEQDPAYQDWAQETLAILQSRSPMAMCMVLMMQRRARKLSLGQCFAMELQAIAHWFEKGDFVEGVRAVIVDKDRNPQWRFTRVEDVPVALLEEMLAGY